MDLSQLTKGIMVVIGIALATGHYDELERWSRHQAINALEWKEPLPYFFPQEPENKQAVMPRNILKAPKKPSKL
jgi:hypothetical protein